MTSRNSISELYAPKYYLFLLKRNWSQSFIYFIILFLSMPVALLIKINNTFDIESWTEIRRIQEISETISNGLVYLWGALAVAFAIFSGILFMNFITERKKAYLYHSFPVKRKTHLFTHVAVCISSFLIAFVSNTLISLLVFWARGVTYGEIISEFIYAILISCVFFIIALSLTVLACALAGQTSSIFLLLICFAFLPLVLYLSAVQFLTFHSEFINVEYFINETVATKLSIAFRFFFLAVDGNRYTVFEGIITVLVSIAIFVLSYFIYKKRRTELAGTPIINPVLGETLKYLVLFPASFYAGYIFYLIGGQITFWLYFGFICGAFLVFIFFNLFLYRSQRKMFFNFKGLLIFIVLFVFAFSLTFLNTGKNIPDSDKVKSVEVEIRGKVYEFYDKDTVSFVTEQSKDMISEVENLDYFSGYVDVTFKKPFSIPCARKIPIYADDKYSKLFFTLLTDDEYLESHEKLVSELISDDSGSLYLYIDGLSHYGASEKEMRVDQNEFIYAYLKDIKNPHRYEGQYICSVYLRSGITLYVYSTDENILNLCYSGQSVNNISQLYQKGKAEIKALCQGVRVYEYGSEKYVDYTGEMAEEILDACVSYDYFRNSPALHPNYSSEYEVRIYLSKYEMENKGEEKFDTESDYSFYNAFLNGKIPSFVISDFVGK